jgi:hypothetical protein
MSTLDDFFGGSDTRDNDDMLRPDLANAAAKAPEYSDAPATGMFDPKCSHRGCTERAGYGIDVVTCWTHRLICSICDEPATLFSPAGILCRVHADQACGIEMNGAYPSHRAILQVRGL